MICQKCNQPMKMLFTSMYCDCDKSEAFAESDSVCETDEYGTKIWKELHRLDEPTVEYTEWWQNGKLHHLDGPAVEWLHKTKE